MRLIVPATAVAALLIGLTRQRLRLVVVQGRSMEPTIHDGQRLLFRRTKPTRLRTGAVTLFTNPLHQVGVGPPQMVKRLVAVGGSPTPKAVLDASNRIPPGIRTSLSVAEDIPTVVPEGYVMVLGDSPGLDSALRGPIDAHLVWGQAEVPGQRSRESAGARHGSSWFLRDQSAQW